MGFLKNVPFTYHWIIRRAIGDDVKTVLDLGCGEGDFMEAISKGENWEITGVELFKEAVQRARKSGVYKEVVEADVVKLPKSISTKKFDVVFCSQVLEHLDKEEGEKVLKEWEKLAKKRIVISTPVGFTKYEPIEKKEESNPLLRHQSGWTPVEFTKHGYTVRGQGFKLVYGENGLARILPKFFHPISEILSYLVAPIVYSFSKFGLIMICIKEKNAE